MKHYIQPLADIVSAEAVSFICGSGKSSGQLPAGTDNPPTSGSDGNIHGESKEYDSATDWDNEDW